MRSQEHSIVRDGAIAGAVGALIVVIWYLALDTAGGRPFHTPNLLGGVLVDRDLGAAGRHVVPELVLGYTVLHFVFFMLIGMALAVLVRLATRDISLLVGVWIGLVVALGLFAGLTLTLGAASGAGLSPWSIVSGGLLGVLGMAGYLWRRHPRLGRSFDQEPIGAEGRAPPHPPDRPSGA